MTKDNAHAFLGDEYLVYADSAKETEKEEEEAPRRSVEIVEEDGDVVRKVAYADDDDNFIFVGKGWGHGVGMSQYGARDLAEMGYNYQEILHAYFTDVDIVDWEDFQ